MQNIIAANLKVESEGYQAITTLGKMPVTEHAAILEMALVKREQGRLEVCDTFNSGVHTTDDTARGGLVGSILGILGGPVGILLGGSAGALTGSIIDAGDAGNTASMIETVASKMQDGEVSLIILAEEDSEADLDAKLGKYDGEIIRFDAAVIAEEVEEAEKAQKEMERLARIRLRETKKEEHKKNVEEKRTKIAADFERFKAKFKKQG